MKTSKSKLTTVFVLLAPLMLLANCKGEPSCPGNNETYQYMPEGSKNILPHTGFDTLYFLTNLNDTITCIGRGRTTFFETNYVVITPDCGGQKINYEGYKDNYESLIIEQTKSPIYSINNEWLPSFKLKWNGDVFSIYTFLVGSKVAEPSTKPSFIYHDSIIVNNNIYSKVTELRSNKQNKLFLNRQNGIIQLTDVAQNVNWEIIK